MEESNDKSILGPGTPPVVDESQGGSTIFVSPLPVRALARLQAPAGVTFALEASPEGAPEATAEAMPHWAGVRRVFRCLSYSRYLGLCYGSDSQDVTLLGYLDSNCAGDATDRKSTMGYVHLLHGAAVTWAVRKEQSISTSTTEAEYVGLCNAAKEAVWLRNLLPAISVYCIRLRFPHSILNGSEMVSVGDCE
jgi:hypothetical protein